MQRSRQQAALIRAKGDVLSTDLLYIPTTCNSLSPPESGWLVGWVYVGRETAFVSRWSLWAEKEGWLLHYANKAHICAVHIYAEIAAAHANVYIKGRLCGGCASRCAPLSMLNACDAKGQSKISTGSRRCLLILQDKHHFSPPADGVPNAIEGCCHRDYCASYWASFVLLNSLKRETHFRGEWAQSALCLLYINHHIRNLCVCANKQREVATVVCSLKQNKRFRGNFKAATLVCGFPFT